MKVFFKQVHNEFIPVLGKRLTLDGYTNFKFFAYQEFGQWYIAEVTTGQGVSEPENKGKTLAQTIVDTLSRLSRYGMTSAKMQALIDNSVKSPCQISR